MASDADPRERVAALEARVRKLEAAVNLIAKTAQASTTLAHLDGGAVLAALGAGLKLLLEAREEN